MKKKTETVNNTHNNFVPAKDGARVAPVRVVELSLAAIVVHHASVWGETN